MKYIFNWKESKNILSECKYGFIHFSYINHWRSITKMGGDMNFPKIWKFFHIIGNILKINSLEWSRKTNIGISNKLNEIISIGKNP